MSCEVYPIILNPDEFERASHLFEGEHWRAALRSQDQSLIGTSFITAKRHVESLSELSVEERLEFFEIENVLERAMRQAFGAQVVNVSCLMNLTFTENDTPAPHVHWHLKSRYAHPIIFRGDRYEDPAFGSYLDGHHPRRLVDTATAVSIVNELQNNFR